MATFDEKRKDHGYDNKPSQNDKRTFREKKESGKGLPFAFCVLQDVRREVANHCRPVFA